MLRLITIFISSITLFLGLSALMHFVAAGRNVENVSIFLEDWSRSLSAIDLNDKKLVEDAMRARVRLYEEEIEEFHIFNGMLVNRALDGMVIDECDSLLFSSLRYVALNKLGYLDKAREAWAGIESSQLGGKWLRHPKCTKSTSRDMIVGLLAAMTQYPDELEDYLKSFFKLIRDNRGYFGDGPFHVSFLTPGLAEVFRRIALAEDLRHSDLPQLVKNGFSTFEWSSFATGRGYEAHLVALSLWLELEMQEVGFRKGEVISDHSIARSISPLISVFSKKDMFKQRVEIAAQNLIQLDPNNLFFKYLRLRTAGALTSATRLVLMKELISMPQFPHSRLPMDCDRRADYLWQRNSDEYQPSRRICSQQFNGVDFIWMAGLLLEK